MLSTLLILTVIVILWRKWQKIYNPKHPLQLNVYFGVPGSGKTTLAAYFAKKCQKESLVIKICKRFPCWLTNKIINGKHWKRVIKVFSNVPIQGTLKLDARKDIGHVMIEDGKMIIDEAGVEFNSRSYKTFSQEAIKFFKYHRHYGVSVDVFSQSHEDMDITLRRLAQKFYIVKKSLIPYFIVLKPINRKVGIDDMTHQITDMYYFPFLGIGTKHIFMPTLWKMFDTYEHEELPAKVWETWNNATPKEPWLKRKLSVLKLHFQKDVDVV